MEGGWRPPVSKWYSKARMPAPARKRASASVSQEFFWLNMCCSIGAAGFRPSSRAHTRRWALALRPEHHPRSDQSDTSSSQHAGHAVRRNRTRNAAGTFSGHTASAVGGSANGSRVGRVSPTTSGSSKLPRGGARSHWRLDELLVVGSCALYTALPRSNLLCLGQCARVSRPLAPLGRCARCDARLRVVSKVPRAGEPSCRFLLFLFMR